MNAKYLFITRSYYSYSHEQFSSGYLYLTKFKIKVSQFIYLGRLLTYSFSHYLYLSMYVDKLILLRFNIFQKYEVLKLWYFYSSSFKYAWRLPNRWRFSLKNCTNSYENWCKKFVCFGRRTNRSFPLEHACLLAENKWKKHKYLLVLRMSPLTIIDYLEQQLFPENSLETTGIKMCSWVEVIIQ